MTSADDPQATRATPALQEDEVARLATEIALTFPGAASTAGTTHALLRETTLCGQDAATVERQDDPFAPLATAACPDCTTAFATFAAVIPTLSLAESWKDMRPRSGYHNQLKAQFGTELDAEVGDDHPLTGTPAVVVANAEDDVVLALADGRVAVTRLTWSREVETPPAPATTFVDPAGTVPAAAALDLGS